MRNVVDRDTLTLSRSRSSEPQEGIYLSSVASLIASREGETIPSNSTLPHRNLVSQKIPSETRPPNATCLAIANSSSPSRRGTGGRKRSYTRCARFELEGFVPGRQLTRNCASDLSCKYEKADRHLGRRARAHTSIHAVFVAVHSLLCGTARLHSAMATETDGVSCTTLLIANELKLIPF